MKAVVGVSTLPFVYEPFDLLPETILRLPTKYVEVLDDGLHELNGDRVRILTELARSHNLTYSVHAPFADVNIATTSDCLLQAALDRLKRSLFHASRLEAKMFVLHSGCEAALLNQCTPDDVYRRMARERNLESVRRLLRIAEDYGVRVGLENGIGNLIRTAAEAGEFLRSLNAEIGLVFDVAHANLFGEAHSYFEALKERIVHMHVSDNDGKRDQHVGIGHGDMNWGYFADMLRKADYHGAVIVESESDVEESVLTLKHLLE